MSRIAACFSRLKAEGKTALIPFVTAGDPSKEVTVPLMHKMVAAGASLIELGVPFSDPMADGPTIQRASERALEANTSLLDVLSMVEEFRQQDSTTPIILMGYLNPIEVMGYQKFAEAAAKAGVDGAFTVDIPPEVGEGFLEAMQQNQLDPIFLLAPTSSAERIERICSAASGFVYYVSLKGVTGAGHLDIGAVQSKVDEIRSHTDLPVGVGFGIKDAETASQMSSFADAVVVGSAVVNRVEENQHNAEVIQQEIAELLNSMREAMDKT
jgi:tryptophan synthase alpha chain